MGQLTCSFCQQQVVFDRIRPTVCHHCHLPIPAPQKKSYAGLITFVVLLLLIMGCAFYYFLKDTPKYAEVSAEVNPPREISLTNSDSSHSNTSPVPSELKTIEEKLALSPNEQLQQAPIASPIASPIAAPTANVAPANQTNVAEIKSPQTPAPTGPTTLSTSVIQSASNQVVDKTPFAPSFDCLKITSTVDDMICDDRELSNLDLQMAQFYKAARERSTNKNQLKAEQVAWVKNKRACENRSCIEKAYRDRIKQLTN